MSTKKIHPGEGHRGRLRERFLQSGLDGFLDYEIVELLLTLGTPRKDCKKIAKEAIKAFGGLQGVLDASLQDLQQIDGIGPSNAFGIKLFQAVSERYAREHIPKNITLDSPKAVADYLQKSIGLEKKEHFVMLSLNVRNNLVKISDVSIGSLNASIVHPREVFREAIQSSAAQIIVAHNHPSGDPNASPEDVALTRRLGDAAKILGIELLDHIIVTNNKYSSMKEQKLM
ncbi:MAG: DNA repair protein RadC [Candidatus Jorgensenbacteria bacterium]|nr:DNA repair protein RadC [Candidatus Jorgensenbacteria bacterium]